MMNKPVFFGRAGAVILSIALTGVAVIAISETHPVLWPFIYLLCVVGLHELLHRP